MIKNYDSELSSRIKKAVKPYASAIREQVTLDDQLRHRAHSFHSEAAEDKLDALQGRIVETNGSEAAINELLKWGGSDMRIIKAHYGTIANCLENARERNAQLFRGTAVAAAEAALAVVDAIASEAQRQWQKVCEDAGEPVTTAAFVRGRCGELQEALHCIIEDDPRFGIGTLAEFCD